MKHVEAMLETFDVLKMENDFGLTRNQVEQLFIKSLIRCGEFKADIPVTIDRSRENVDVRGVFFCQEQP